jgi:hypothetical protein
MSRAGRDLRRLVREFLEERESFWGFHEAFLAKWTHLPPETFTGDELEGWNQVYAWILTAIPDPVSEEDGSRGVIGEAELRNRLRPHPLLRPPG